MDCWNGRVIKTAQCRTVFSTIDNTFQNIDKRRIHQIDDLIYVCKYRFVLFDVEVSFFIIFQYLSGMN